MKKVYLELGEHLGECAVEIDGEEYAATSINVHVNGEGLCHVELEGHSSNVRVLDETTYIAERQKISGYLIGEKDMRVLEEIKALEASIS